METIDTNKMTYGYIFKFCVSKMYNRRRGDSLGGKDDERLQTQAALQQ